MTLYIKEKTGYLQTNGQWKMARENITIAARNDLVIIPPKTVAVYSDVRDSLHRFVIVDTGQTVWVDETMISRSSPSL